MPDIDATPTALLPPPHSLAVDPSLIDGRYRIVRELGGGGMGIVYEAEDVLEGDMVALKIMTPQNGWDAIVRFHREAQIAAASSTRHIVQIFAAGRDARTDRHYLAMELLDGEDVSQLADRWGPLPAAIALRIAIQCCAGLSCAHRRGTTHRDIKPANLFLSRDDDQVVVKVLDFGAAKVADTIGPALTSPGTLIGSPHYMSPEQARGATVDHRADIWGLGVVLYKLLSGRVPFADVTSFGGLMLKIFREEVPPIRSVAPWVLPEVAHAIHRALQKPTNERYDSADEMAYALLPLAGGSAVLHAHDFPPVPSGIGDTVPCHSSLPCAAASTRAPSSAE